MRKIIFLLMILWLLLLVQCSSGKSQEVEEIVLEEKTGFIDLQWKKEKSVDVSDVNFAFLYLDTDETTVNVYGFSVKRANKIVFKKYDRGLNLTFEKHFNTGQGPGDLGGGPNFFSCGDYIYVPDNTQQRVNIFDKELNFVKFVKTPRAFSSPIFINDGNYFIGTELVFDERRRTLSHIHIISFPQFNKKKIHTFGPSTLFDRDKKIILGAIPEFDYFFKHRKIYLINMKTYRVMMFDLSGKLLKQVRVDVPPIPVPDEKKKMWIKEQTDQRLLNRVKIVDFVQPAGWMIPLAKGFVVIRRNSYSIFCRGLVEGDYFDYHLRLLGKVNFPCFFLVYHLRQSHYTRAYEYDDGYVYLVTQDLQETDEDINLEKWRIVE